MSITEAKMRNLEMIWRTCVRWLALSLVAVLASCGSHQPDDQTGTLEMALRSDLNGVAYRLRSAVFEVSGQQRATLRSEDNPNAEFISKTLKIGKYSIELTSGWRLEKSTPSGFQTVEASLTSKAIQQFTIKNKQTTSVTYEFKTDGGTVSFGTGGLKVGIKVGDASNAPAHCSDGMESGDEEGKDCGGSCPKPCRDDAGDALTGALDGLEKSSTVPLKVLVEGGKVRVVALDAPTTGDSPVERALNFLTDHRDVFGLADPKAELYLQRIESADGEDHLFFRQRLGQFPIVGAEIAVHLAADRVYLLNGDALESELAVRAQGEPVLNADKAATAAQAWSGQGFKVLGKPRLVLLRLGADKPPVGAWLVGVVGGATAKDPGSSFQVYVEAATGKILKAVNGVQEAIFDLRHAHNRTNDACWWFEPAERIWTQDGPDASFPSGDTDAETMVTSVPRTWNFYFDTYGRVSWSGDNSSVYSFVHVGVDWDNANYVSWPCNMFQFGEGWARLDVQAHEFTHGVVGATAGLEYRGESGALNESFADVFAALVDDDDWIMGEDIDGRPGGIRSLEDPPVFGLPDHVDPAISGDGAGLRDTSDSFDEGFVHFNSSITNKAAFLVAAGGTHNGLTITGIGRADMGALWYRVLTRHLNSHSSFREMAAVTIDIAGSSEQCTVRNAFASVGLADADRDCDGAPDAEDTDDDGDWVADSRDNCPLLRNSGQQDADGDGVGNACDDDQDGDGLENGADNCPLVANADQVDSDGDGAGDPCDDGDRDGFIDADDNCPDTFNPGQGNIDGDSRGDACDTDRDNDGVTNTADSCPDRVNLFRDPDADGIDSACDNCPTVSNDGQEDGDEDGTGDVCDSDRDGDGLPNDEDSCPDDFDAAHVDFDGDGVSATCDDDERDIFNGEELGRLFGDLDLNDLFGAVIPIDPCLADGCPDWFPADFTTNIMVDAPIGTQLRLTDSDGTIVAWGSPRESGQLGNVLSLDFSPASDSHYLSPSKGALPLSLRSYQIELMAPAKWGSEPLPVGVEVSSYFPK